MQIESRPIKLTSMLHGNSCPRYMRPSLYSFSTDPNIINQTNIPQGVIIQPLADPSQFEELIPQVDCRNSTIFRCSRCKGYVNPYFTFTENGNSVVCNLCKMVNKVPPEYFCPLNEYRQRTDKYDKFELHRGVYEFIAPKEYIKKEIKNNYIFIILEMTSNSVCSGIFTQAIYSLQAILDSIPNPERTDIAIATYDQCLNFFNIPKDLSNDPQLIIVGDLDDPYCPLPKESIFINIQNDREKINYLIEKLLKSAEKLTQETQKFFQNSASIGAVIQSAVNLLDNCPGRIIAFTSQLPSKGYGSLKKREEKKIANVDQEKAQFLPQLARQCLDSKITIDLFVFCPDFFDLATIGILCTLTGGQLYYYPYYNGNLDGERIHYELFRNLTRYYVYDCVMTLRTSPGIILQEYYTGAGKIQVRDLELSSLNADRSLAIIYKQEEKIPESQAYLQFALLCTNTSGQRVVRIINLEMQVHSSIANLFKSADLDSVTNLIIRKNIHCLGQLTINQIREQISNSVVNILHSYRANCASTNSPGQLILPESLKLLPLYSQSLFKQDIRIDDRINDLIKFSSCSTYYLQNQLYPKLYEISSISTTQEVENSIGDKLEDGKVIMPSTIASSIERVYDDGIYLLDNGELIFIYITQNADPTILNQLLGVDDFSLISQQIFQLPNNPDNIYNQRINNLIDQLRRNKIGAYQGVRIIPEKDPSEQYFLKQLIEDDYKGNESYGDYLCTIHKKIQDKFA